MKKNDLELKNQNRKALVNFEAKLRRGAKVRISENWDLSKDETHDPDEILLTNTFLNSQPALTIGMPFRKGYGLLRKVKWMDQSTGDKKRIISLEIPRYQDIHFEKVIKRKEEIPVQSIIKVFPE